MFGLSAHTQKFSVHKCAAVLCLFHCLVALVWLALDSSWFSVPHFTALTVLETALSTKPDVYPLLHFFEALCLLLTSFSVWAFAVPGILSFIVLLFCVGALGRELELDSYTSCLWLGILSFCPVVFGTMRWYDFHLPLICAVTVCALMLVRLRRAPSLVRWLGFAAAVTVGGLLCGGSTPTETLVFWLNCGGPIFWFFAVRIRERGALHGLVFLFLCCLLFALDMAVVFSLSGWSWDSMLGYYSVEIGRYSNLAGSFWVWGRALFINVAGLSSSQLGLPFFLLLCLSAPVFVKKESGMNRLLILSWFLFPLIVFGLVPKKSLAFTNPVSVPSALICAAGIKALKPGRRVLSVCVSLAVGLCIALSFFEVSFLRKVLFFPGRLMPVLNNVAPDYGRRAMPVPDWGREFLEKCRERIVHDGRNGHSVFVCRSDRFLHHLSALGMELFFDMKKARPQERMFLSHTGIPVGNDVEFVVSAMARALKADYLLLDSVSRGFLFDNPFGSDFIAPVFGLAAAQKPSGLPGVFLYARKDDDLVRDKESLFRVLAFGDRIGGGNGYLDVDGLKSCDMEPCAVLLEFMTGYSSNIFLRGEYLVALVRVYTGLGRAQSAQGALGRLIEMARGSNDTLFCAEYMTQAAELCRDMVRDNERALELFEQALESARKVSGPMRRKRMIDDIVVQKKELAGSLKK